MKITFKQLLVIISILLASLVIFNKSRIQFEYYLWNLNSEQESDRETAAGKIVEMGYPAIPFIMANLEGKHIFESYYMVDCMEKITRIQTYDKKHADFYNEKIPFWKKWFEENRSKY